MNNSMLRTGCSNATLRRKVKLTSRLNHLNIALSRPAVVVDNANQGHAFRIRTVTVRRRYNSRVKTEEFRILLGAPTIMEYLH